MASGNQVALTRAQRMPAPSTHISKAARQVVPAFLQKLYEMVNDPNNADLIRWSDAGDSFFVLDHERFAHEVLGRWFKHRNFSSFVRQLNMYGFHKIPHLQQGVLKSDTETEFWNFAHANFHRGQPDLLCLIQRKKQPQNGEEGAVDLRDAPGGVALLGAPNAGAGVPAQTPPTLNATLSSGQILDVHSIVNGIAAIKRHQTTISAELNELKRSNQLLWQESMNARAKHQKQQDIINRIVKFLAGVFGNNTAGSGAGNSSTGSPGTPGGSHVDDGVGDALGMAPGTRRKMRLMIEDAKRDGPKKSMIEELTEVPMDIDGSIYGDPSYPTIETPLSDTTPSAPSPAPSTTASEKITVADLPLPHKEKPPNAMSSVSSSKPNFKSSTSTNTTEPSSFSTKPSDKTQQTPLSQPQAGPISRAVTPVGHSPPSFEFDPRLHGLMNQFTPSQLQSLLTILAPQTFTDPNQPVPSSTSVNPSTTSGLLTPYVQPSSFDFSINPTSQVNNQPSFGATPLSSDGLIPFDQYLPDSPKNLNTTNTLSPQQLQQPPERLDRQWQAAEDIDKDVNALNTSINTLIQTFGLDPSLLEGNIGMDGSGSAPSETTKENTSGTEMDNNTNNNNTVGGGMSSPPVDFDFDTFFNNLSSIPGPSGSSGSGEHVDPNAMDYNDLVSTAFLDEVATPSSSDMTASPLQTMRQVTPELNMGAGTGSHAGGLGTAAANAYTTTDANVKGFSATSNMSGLPGRKRKSDVDFDSIIDPSASASASKVTTTGTAAKSKRRKDK